MTASGESALLRQARQGVAFHQFEMPRGLSTDEQDAITTTWLRARMTRSDGQDRRGGSDGDGFLGLLWDAVVGRK